VAARIRRLAYVLLVIRWRTGTGAFRRRSTSTRTSSTRRTEPQ